VEFIDMTLETLLQPLIYGLQIGLTYVLVALGLTVIFSIMNVINLAHGEIYMLGAFCVFYLCSLLHINYITALLISMVAVGLAGVILERFFFRPVRGQMIATVIIAMGLMWILQTFAQLVFGRQPRGMGEAFHGTTALLNVNISNSRIIAGLISIALVIAVYFFVYKTKQGRAMQAMAQDQEAAALQGVDINRVGALGFGLGCALAGAAGGIMAPILFIEATMGTNILIKSLAIIILGGIGSIPGAAIGGLILGIAESYGHTFLGYPAITFPFVIIILVLLVKRTGLMGRKV
jgi:branched-chain amino acid transport system permease protein